MGTWLMNFFENALVSRVKRRMCMRMDRFDRSTCDVEMIRRVRVALDAGLASNDAHRWRVAFLRLRDFPLQLHELGIVNVGPARAFHRIQVEAIRALVRRGLNAPHGKRAKTAKE